MISESGDEGCAMSTIRELLSLLFDTMNKFNINYKTKGIIGVSIYPVLR